MLLIKGEASTGSLDGVQARIESPSFVKNRRLKVNKTDDEDQLMRHSIGMAEYEKKLADLQQRIISVHTPYNDASTFDELNTIQGM